MTEAIAVNAIHEKAHEHDLTQVNPTGPKKGKSQDSQNLTPFLTAYYYILQSIITAHNTAETQVKQLQANASEQSRLISKEQKLKYVTLAYGQVFQKQYEYSYTLGWWSEGTFIWSGHDHGSTNFDHWGTVTWDTVSAHLGSGQHMSWLRKRTIGERTLTLKVNSTLLDTKMMTNTDVSGARGVITAQLSLCGQGAQISESELNSTASSDNMDVSAASSLTQEIMSITSRIAQI